MKAESTTKLSIKLYNPFRSFYARRISNNEWDSHKAVLSLLHAEGATRKAMLTTLRDKFSFEPSLPQLNAKMTEWGFKVYGRDVQQTDPSSISELVFSTESAPNEKIDIDWAAADDLMDQYELLSPATTIDTNPKPSQDLYSSEEFGISYQENFHPKPFPAYLDPVCRIHTPSIHEDDSETCFLDHEMVWVETREVGVISFRDRKQHIAEEVLCIIETCLMPSGIELAGGVDPSRLPYLTQISTSSAGARLISFRFRDSYDVVMRNHFEWVWNNLEAFSADPTKITILETFVGREQYEFSLAALIFSHISRDWLGRKSLLTWSNVEPELIEHRYSHFAIRSGILLKALLIEIRAFAQSRKWNWSDFANCNEIRLRDCLTDRSFLDQKLRDSLQLLSAYRFSGTARYNIKHLNETMEILDQTVRVSIPARPSHAPGQEQRSRPADLASHASNIRDASSVEQYEAQKHLLDRPQIHQTTNNVPAGLFSSLLSLRSSASSDTSSFRRTALRLAVLGKSSAVSSILTSASNASVSTRGSWKFEVVTGFPREPPTSNDQNNKDNDVSNSRDDKDDGMDIDNYYSIYDARNVLQQKVPGGQYQEPGTWVRDSQSRIRCS